MTRVVAFFLSAFAWYVLYRIGILAPALLGILLTIFVYTGWQLDRIMSAANYDRATAHWLAYGMAASCVGIAIVALWL